MHPLVAKNRTYWDHLVGLHVPSAFYGVEGFAAGRQDIDSVVAEALGDVGGLRVLHLQCHFGLDTLALARRGANVTGLDFSPNAVEAARSLAARLELDARFVEGDVLTAALGTEFDLVFSSWGAIGWLPDLRPWAATVARHLAPGARFVLVEGHPILWMMSESWPPAVKYPYAGGDPIVEEPKTGSYAAPDAPVPHPNYGWNHALSAVIGALLGEGLVLRRLEEGDRIPWAAWPEMVVDGTYWRMPAGAAAFPLSMTIVVERPR
jgi:SAM-dependent methyltransferase